MKQYEKAIMELPQIGDLKFVKEEVDMFLDPKTQHEKEQAPVHILKAANMCLWEWCKSEEFGPEVVAGIKNVDYDNLDLFQKGVLHILASCQYKDGFFDIEKASVDYEWDVDKWKKSLNIS